MKRIGGSSYISPEKGGPAWSLPKEIQTCKDLRKEFGREVVFSDEIVEWGREEKEREERLKTLNSAGTAELIRLPERLPEMYGMLRPYQRSGIRFVAESTNPFICDQQGLGKTWISIGGVFEAGMENGPQLVIAPKISLDNVWLNELNRLQDMPVFVADEGRRNRQRLMSEIMMMAEIEEPFWLVINPQMVALTRKKFQLESDEDEFEVQYPELLEIMWNTIIIDETSRAAMGNSASMGFRGIKRLNGHKRIAMDGTPVRGKPIRVWSVLNWLEPAEFKSKHRWADKWVDYDDTTWGRKFNGIREGKEEEFYKAHARYILRRTKAEVLKELPPKQTFEIWAEMDPKQAKQYERMKKDAEMTIEVMEEEGTLNATSVLAQYTRLKQFAGAYCDVELDPNSSRHIVTQTAHSCKMDHLMGILEDLNIADPEYDEFDDSEKEQVVVFTQFGGMANMVYTYLNSKGIPTAMIKGATNRSDRREIKDDFQEGGKYRVLVMTTTAGGVAITLDRASTVVFLDETWVPDDQEQAEDRCHRASRIHQVNVYYIRTRGTIEEYIRKVNDMKANINEVILDLHRVKEEYE